MLRPVRPLRRPSDIFTQRSGSVNDSGTLAPSRRPSRQLRAASGSSASVAPTTVEDGTRDTTLYQSSPPARSAVTLPELRPCLTRHQGTPSGSATAAKLPGHAAHTTAISKYEKASSQEERSEAANRGGCAGGGMGSSAADCLPSTVKSLSTDKSNTRDALWKGELLSLPPPAQRLFTSAEIDQLRADARMEYTRGRRVQEQRDLLHDEEEQRRLLLSDAVSQYNALCSLQQSCYEALLRARSEAALPLQFLEQRIETRIRKDYAHQDAEFKHKGRVAWKEEVALARVASAEAESSEVERRAASHRFRAALTFVIVQERNMRGAVEEEAAREWEIFAVSERASKAEAEHRALVRFLNTPEQLALAAARERRERRQAKLAAKQRKLFDDQQSGFIKGCHHGVGGTSVFEGDAAKKICGRCRVKWDEEHGYFISLDRSVKTHEPPPLASTESAASK